MISTIFVLSESFVLVQSRLGIEAARSLHEVIRPYLFLWNGGMNDCT